MPKLLNSMDDFFYRFSYSGKVNLVFFIGVLVALITFTLLGLSQKPLLDLVEWQKLICQSNLNISIVLKDSTELQALQEISENKSLHLRSEIDKNLHALETTLRLASLVFDEDINSEIQSNLHLLLASWNELKKTPLTLPGFKPEYQDFLQSLQNVFDFIQNELQRPATDGSSQRLIQALFNLIQNQFLKGRINKILKQPAEDFTLDTKVKLAVIEDHLLENSQEVIRDLHALSLRNDIDPFFENQEEDKKADFLLQYSHTLDSQHNFALISKIAEQLLSHLKAQKETLNFRQYVGLCVLFIGLFTVFCLYLTKVIRHPVADLRDAAIKLAGGSLSVRLKIMSKDEVAQMSLAFNDMAQLFENVIQEAVQIVFQLGNFSSDIFTTSKQLETNTVQQESLVNQIAIHSNNISNTSKAIGYAFKEVNKSAILSSGLAIQGSKNLIEMEQTLQKMEKAATKIVDSLTSLQEKIQNINKVINAIIKIADQSNLLSLNTALKAYKTDMKGVGFSIIAEKIRELADQTAHSTLHIEELVKEVFTSVSNTFQEVDNVSAKITVRIKDASEINEGLKILIQNSEAQICTFEKVNHGMQEQIVHVSQIHQSLLLQIESSKQTTQSIGKLYRDIEYLHQTSVNLVQMTKKWSA